MAAYAWTTSPRRAARAVVTTSLVLAAGLAAAPPSIATEHGPIWSAPATSTIHPGILTNTAGQFCTANFVFLDSRGGAYLGQAAHCSAAGIPAEAAGCSTASMPLGTEVWFGDSGVRGVLAYSSWLTMQDRETDATTCARNDFALVRIPAEAIAQANPSLPVFGGPTALRTSALRAGEPVLSYGNSPLRAGIGALSPKQGVSLGTGDAGWAHPVYTATPGIPGDSGSGFIDASGAAFGVLSTLTLTPLPASNGVIDLGRALDYAAARSGIPGLRLALGTTPFTRSAMAPALF